MILYDINISRSILKYKSWSSGCYTNVSIPFTPHFCNFDIQQIQVSSICEMKHFLCVDLGLKVLRKGHRGSRLSDHRPHEMVVPPNPPTLPSPIR